MKINSIIYLNWNEANTINLSIIDRIILVTHYCIIQYLDKMINWISHEVERAEWARLIDMRWV